VVEQYQIDPVASAQNSREIIERKTRALCSTELAIASATLMSPPLFRADVQMHSRSIWLIAYTYGAKTFQVVVNGFNCLASSLKLDQDHARCACGPDYRTGDLRAFEIGR
jgi:hypothetical protein